MALRRAGAMLMLGAKLEPLVIAGLNIAEANQGYYWSAFMGEVFLGELTKAAIKARVALYGAATWQIAMNAQRSYAIASGQYREERRRLRRGGEHCEQCIDYGDLGWQPIGTLPPIGDQSCSCKSNCQCFFLYR